MTHKQIIKYIIREESIPEITESLKQNRLNLGLKNDEKFLIYLRKVLNISSLEYESILNKIESTQPMPHTQLLNFIITQLEEQGFKWNGQEELFHILIPNEKWEEYKKSWYQWQSEYTQQIKKDTIRQAIQSRLKFSSYVWTLPEKEQKKLIPTKIEAFIKIERNQNETREKFKTKSMDFSEIEPFTSSINRTQEQLLEKISVEVVMNIELLLDENRAFFSDKKENQQFLFKVVPILYNKGFYQFLKEKVFPFLSRQDREKVSIKMQEAYTLINCECSNYEEIFYLLKSIPETSEEQKTTINTMIIHAFMKYKIYNHDLTKEELFEVLKMSIGYYHSLYKSNKSSLCYYPAIQLAYMIQTLKILFPSRVERNRWNIDQIYTAVKPAIQKDKELGGVSEYTATMSQFEFLLLINHSYDSFELEMFMEDFQPEISLVTQTMNQIQCFIDMIERFDNENRVVDSFSKTLQLFESYISWK